MLKFFNTLTRKLEEFKPLNKGSVRMYTCGPTVYNYPHIGNYRAYVFEDVLRRYLKYKGYTVTQVMNITDVDDKTIRDSQKEGISLSEFTQRYEKGFLEDLKTLNIEKAEHYPRATDYVNEMVEIIKVLLKKGIAYKTGDGSIYYDISKFKGYGKLAHIKVENLKEGARVKNDEYEKEEAKDFALWKSWDENDGPVFWNTELGKGRPGWHIECSAMSIKLLGEQFDIHTGGIDNIFPHHENEIAQSEAYSDKKFVNYWMHCDHLLVEGKKMSKSLGNFFTLRDILDKKYDPKAIRYLLISVHYKQQLNFTFSALDASKSAVSRLNEFIKNLGDAGGKENKKVASTIKKARLDFEKSLDDDLNMSNALAAVFDFVRDVNRMMEEGELSKNNASECAALMKEFDKILGVLDEKEEILEGEIVALIEKRENARRGKNFVESDRIRDSLLERGIILEDTPKGVRWKKTK